MQEKNDYNFLLNFYKGKYSYNDYIKVKKYFNKTDESKVASELLFNQWKELTEATNDKDYSLNHIFDKIHYSILLDEKKRTREKVIWSFYRQAAAILLIPVLAFSLWFYYSSKSSALATSTQSVAQSWVEINAPEGARVQFLLPDSTSGWLNSGSKLKYPSVFNGNRKVELSGEAYFEVVHRNQSDFVVGVADLDIKVLGTKFNVSAYSDDSFTNVVLTEGKVEIEGKTGVFNQILRPNEKITFHRDSKSLNLKPVDADRYSAWKDGYLIIENEPLGEVIPRIERWYNAEIIVLDKELCNYRFKATFRNEPLEEVLRLVALTTPLKYKIDEREEDGNGITKRRKITIKLKN